MAVFVANLVGSASCAEHLPLPDLMETPEMVKHGTSALREMTMQTGGGLLEEAEKEQLGW